MYTASFAILIFILSNINRSETAVDHLLTVEYQAEQARLGVNWGVHPEANTDLKRDVSIGIAQAAMSTGLDPELIAAVAWRESRFSRGVFSLDRRGAIGEKGLMQVHGVAAKGCDLSTAQGQIMCGAKWLKHSIDRCNGDTVGGIARYMSGYECKPTGGFGKTCRSRNNLYKRLRRINQW